MEIEISEDIILKTKCRRECSCFNSELHCCKIVNCVDSTVHFVEPVERSCNYLHSFGYSYFCCCPVRKEIYRKYGL